MILAGMQYERAGYAIRSHDVVHKHGVWWRTVTTIPFNRMQHCEISQGPIQNLFGLATLRVFTAGGSSSDLSIEGLEHDEARKVKDFIAGKISNKEDGVPLPLTEETLLDNLGDSTTLELQNDDQ